MNLRRHAIFVLPLIASIGFAAAADDNRDGDEARKSGDADKKVEVARSGSDDSCACPKEGNWNAQNLKGWMNCTGPVTIKQTLDPVKDKGTIWVLDEQCSSIFSEASRKQDEDILMERKKDSCAWTGTVSGAANGVQMVIDVDWPTAGEKFIKGDMYSKPNFQGMTCEYYRPYEITFDDNIPEGEYAARRAKMLKKLEKVRASK